MRDCPRLTGYRSATLRLMPALVFCAAVPAQAADTFDGAHLNSIGPINAGACYLVADPDGSVWWSEFNTANVGDLIP